MLFPVDTRRRFNVDTTLYRCWNDVVCLQGAIDLLNLGLKTYLHRK